MICQWPSGAAPAGRTPRLGLSRVTVRVSGGPAALGPGVTVATQRRRNRGSGTGAVSDGPAAAGLPPAPRLSQLKLLNRRGSAVPNKFRFAATVAVGERSGAQLVCFRNSGGHGFDFLFYF